MRKFTKILYRKIGSFTQVKRFFASGTAMSLTVLVKKMSYVFAKYDPCDKHMMSDDTFETQMKYKRDPNNLTQVGR